MIRQCAGDARETTNEAQNAEFAARARTRNHANHSNTRESRAPNTDGLAIGGDECYGSLKIVSPRPLSSSLNWFRGIQARH